MLCPLSILFGAMVGFALGLTGGGGSLLAVPLLVYGLSIAPREAFGVSLAAVGAMALVALVPRIRAHQVELGTGVLFAVAGMLGAPLGAWASGTVPETVLLVAFAALMLLMAWRMWKPFQPADRAAAWSPTRSTPACQRYADGKLQRTSRCSVLLSLIGFTAGFLSGLFGVGGGFVIVPALVLFSGMGIRRAVATSLLVIVLVSISGVSAHIAAGRGISAELTAWFVAGGIGGVSLGSLLGKRLSGPTLQRVFATAIAVVAIFIVSKTLV